MSFPGHQDRFVRRIGARTRQHGAPAAHPLDDPLNHLQVIRDIEGRRFPRGAHGYEAMGAGFEVPIDQRIERAPIEGSGFGHGRDQGHETAFKHAEGIL